MKTFELVRRLRDLAKSLDPVSRLLVVALACLAFVALTPQYQPRIPNYIMVGTLDHPTIASGIAALPAAGGTVMTPPGYTESAATLDIGCTTPTTTGCTTTKPVTLIGGQGTVITITGGAGSTGLRLYNGSTMRCQASAGTGCTIKSAQTSPLSLLSNGQQDGSQEYFYVSNWTFDCGTSQTTSVTFTNGCVDINGVFVPSAIKDSSIIRFSNSIGLHIHSSIGTSGGTNVFLVDNTWVNGGSNTGSRPLVIDVQSTVTGSVTSGTFQAGETVTQATSGATAKVYKAVGASGPMLITSIASGTPNASSTWTGSTSGAVFTPSAAPNLGTLSQVTVRAGAIEHPGLGFHDAEVNGYGSTFQLYGIGINTQFEGTPNNTVSDVYVADAQKVSFVDTNCSGHPPGVPCIELAQTVAEGLDAIRIDNLRGGGASSGTITNDVTGYASPANTYLVPSYYYASTLNSSPAVFEGPTNFIIPADRATAAFAPAAIAGTSMLTSAGIEPSFETGSSTLGTGVTSQCISDAGCVFTRDTTTAAPGLGSASQEITVATASGSDQIHATNAGWSVTAGQAYLITLWAKSSGGTIKGVVSLQNTAATVSYCQTRYLTLTTSWKPFTFACTALASGTDVMLRLSNQVGSGTGNLWYDGIGLFPTSPPDYPEWGALAQANVDGITLQDVNKVISVVTIANASFTFGAQTVAANTCTTSATVTMTGVTTAAAFEVTPTTDITGVSGWGSAGGLVLRAWPTANTFNYRVCNQTAAGITTGSAVTFNVSVHNSGR